MAENYFIKPIDEYKRNINPVKHYIEQMANYLSTMRNIPLDKATDIVKDILKKNKNISIPTVVHYSRDIYKDTHLKETKLTDYIYDSIKNEDIMAPSFTTYINPKKEKSMISEFAMENVTLRAKVKKQMFKEKAAGNSVKATNLNNDQKRYKQYNNSLSGALVANGTSLKNQSGHSSLTSTTRTVSSLGNASNERLIAGNRHYRNPDIILYNIISIVSKIDIDQISSTMEKYNLHYPTVDEVVSVIQRSSDYYFSDTYVFNNKIIPYLNKLSKYQLAAFVYTGDLYQLRNYNSEVICKFIDKLTTKVVSEDTDENILENVNNYDETCIILSKLIHYDELKGNKETVISNIDINILRSIVGTCDNIENTLKEYNDLISTFLVTDHLPPSVAYIKDMIRRTVVLSDTDSTCASYGEWIDWRYPNKKGIDSESIGFSAGVMVLSTQTISHTLATLSSNIGVDKSNLRRLAMKNEYFWTLFCPAYISKTYFASTVVQEGVIFGNWELEYKGVLYKSASAPKPVNNLIKEIMSYVVNSVTSSGVYSLKHILQMVLDMENNILNFIKNKDERALEYFSQIAINEADTYALPPMKSNYFHNLLWENVFAPKYGEVVPPPYRAIKIPIKVSKIEDWCNKIHDKELAKRLLEFYKLSCKSAITGVYVSMDYLSGRGIPEEILSVLDIDRLLLNNLGGVYTLLESLGFITDPKSTYTNILHSTQL